MKLATLQPIPLEIRRMLSLVGVSGLVSLNLVALSLLLRRIAIVAEPIPPAVIVGGGVAMIMLTLASRELTLALPLALPRWAIAALGSSAVLLSCTGLSVPPTSIFAAISVWAIAICLEVAHWMFRSGLDTPAWLAMPTTGEFVSADPKQSPLTSEPSIEPLGGDEPIDEEGTLADEVLSQLTRSRSEAGGEVIYGLLRAEFAIGERQHWLNVAFCPPLPSRPTCSAHFADDANALLEVEEVETYGARLMVRLPKPAEEPTSLVVEMFAESPAG